eukprot:scaffold1232_cov76-Amphora_coffeaeformis.AAC.1
MAAGRWTVVQLYIRSSWDQRRSWWLVADPVEVVAPDVGVDDGETPSTGGDFADERVVVGFGGGAPAGGHEDGLQAGGGEGFVEGNGGGVGGREEGDGVGGSSGVLRLHEDEGHAGLGPV